MQPDLAAGWPVEETQKVEKRGFARARRAGNRDKLALGHGEGGILAQCHRDFAGKTPGKTFRHDHSLCHCAPRKMLTGCTPAALRAGNRAAQSAATIAKAAAIANCGQ